MSTMTDEQKSISELFLEAFQIHCDVESGAASSADSQEGIKLAVQLLDLVTSRTDELRLFSDNEEISEVSSVDLKYMLAPAIRGILTSLIQTPREERRRVVDEAERFVLEFLQRCRDYAIGPLVEIDRSLKQKEVQKAEKNTQDIAALNAKREAKIARFKRGKEIEEQLKHFKSLMGDDLGGTNSDEEVVRKYWLSMLEKYVDVSIENIENLAQEKEMLDFFDKMPDKNNPPPPPQTSTSQNGHPKNFILTRDKVQAQVYGAGYPSLPTMTVEQFYESEVARGCLPDQMTKPASNDKDSASDDDDEALEKQREFDDWKDTHRRGEGNRKNMG